MDDQNKNLLLATALSFVVILVWFFLFPPKEQAPSPDPATVTSQEVPEAVAAPDANEAGAVAADVAEESAPAAADAPRVAIDTPSLTGSLSLHGARLDDLALKGYRVTLDGDDLVKLLTPEGSPYPYYVVNGWSADGDLAPEDVPGPDTVWTLAEGAPPPAPEAASGDEAADTAAQAADLVATLTTDSPVTLTWDNGRGLVFTRRISVDDKYMFTVQDTVANSGAAPATLSPYAFIARDGREQTRSNYILHEGVVRMSDGELQEITYKNLPDLDEATDGSHQEAIEVADRGWIGFTDKYWMTTLIPQAGTPFRSVARYLPGGDVFQTFAREAPRTVAPGQEVTVETRVFAGAKEWETIRAYQNNAGVDRFIDSIDWGMFWFFTKPMFWLLHNLHKVVGNMGFAIIGLTLVIKALVLPLAWKSFSSMARMRELQPEMEKLKEKAGDDRMALQQGMMKLYRDNKVNPASGCLPVLIQIPIFFSLYKVIFVTIELYHAPFVGWVRDLSAPDPSSILNLFGLLPYATPEPGSIFYIFSLGLLPILLGISMWLQQKLNPAPTDPSQKMIFAWMPWVFMFMLGSFASGLVLYWIANNLITFTQQYLIMRSHGTKPDIFGNIRSSLRRSTPAGK
ncbi:Inner membrane protein translocase component YidC, long form [Rubellimicrobium mesophilum DSM 19309]|uniref:Membrane protein insertase YidC n=1 Tax=Rubellimicrobium mesophilum DSM 19309 TaxID=442562 RepID=A0A017HQL3_9RHOB|nr:membrane protein insertase YidC [Rubellimicrobium mesophilum]EYD76802.1 Inner membrane protein translocase component YidC, long form [Rubellimicrobium mesophilum DSM 19309]